VRFFVYGLLLCGLLLSPVQAADSNIDEQLQSLKKEIMQLNRQLFILEDELLYPSSTQLVVFVSVDIGKYFTIDGVELKLNGDTITHYLYTDREQESLSRGGVHRLYMGNVHTGEHQLTAIFTGMGPNQRPLQRATTLSFNKAKEVKSIELAIKDDEGKQQAQFIAKEW